MTYQYTEEQLRLVIGNAIIGNAELTEDDLIKKTFSSEKSSISSVIQSFVRKEFIQQSKNFCRFKVKNWILVNLKHGSSNFIKEFAAAREKGEILKIFPADLQTRLRILEKGNSLGSLLIECSRIFDRLRERLVPVQSADRFRNFLAQWF